MNRFISGTLAGTAAGLAATLFMSVVMLGARRLGLTPRLPPDRIAEAAIERTTQREASHAEERVVASIAHLSFGAAAGAVFGLLASLLASLLGPMRPVALAGIGTVYASAVWLVSYQAWVPGLRILPPASEDDPGRVTTMVVAHWVFGATLGVMTHQLQGRLGR